jgi:hypothetical protein
MPPPASQRDAHAIIHQIYSRAQYNSTYIWVPELYLLVSIQSCVDSSFEIEPEWQLRDAVLREEAQMQVTCHEKEYEAQQAYELWESLKKELQVRTFIAELAMQRRLRLQRCRRCALEMWESNRSVSADEARRCFFPR